MPDKSAGQYWLSRNIGPAQESAHRYRQELYLTVLLLYFLQISEKQKGIFTVNPDCLQLFVSVICQTNSTRGFAAALLCKVKDGWMCWSEAAALNTPSPIPFLDCEGEGGSLERAGGRLFPSHD